MQTIVALLLSGDPQVDPELSVKMPWVDMRIREMPEVAGRLEAMQHRRSMKSHTPMDGLPLDDHAQYICVFRHPLDAHFSFRKHVQNAPIRIFDMWYPAEDTDGVTFRRFLDGGAEGYDTDALPLAHILEHYKAAKALCDRPNVSLFHYADMIRDLPGTFARLAGILGRTHSGAVMDTLIKTATFDNMKANAARYAPSGGMGFWKSDDKFFESGTSNKWHGKLTEQELAGYDAMMDAHLSPEDRDWLEFGTGDHSLP